MRRLLAGVLLALAACSGGAGDDAQYERDLAAAREQAKASLGFFWQHFSEPAQDEYDFSVKAALPRRDGIPGVEEAWVENIARSPDKIVGELSVKPRFLGDLPEGAIVELQNDQIVDWSFMRGEKLLGHYTTRVMLPRMDTTQAEWLRPLLSAKPEGDGAT